MSDLIFHGTHILVRRADITTLPVDAVVNAANAGLRGGSGVDGAIHEVAGPELLDACRAYVREYGSVPAGGATVTPGFNLPAMHVIHAVGPVWRGGEAGEDTLLTRTYARCFDIAAHRGFESVALPCISTGVYGFPKERAARIAVATALAWVSKTPTLKAVIFCVFDEENEAIYNRVLEDAAK